jgi:hypothetical protein
MIAYLRHSEIDKGRWDALLQRCPQRLWYAQSWLLDLASPGWDALVDESSGALFPLTHAVKWGVRYLRQPYGLQQLGVFAPEPEAALDAAMVAAIPRHFRFADILLNARMGAPHAHGARYHACIVHELRLDGTADRLRAAYATGHRRNLRKVPADAPGLIELHDAAVFRALFERTTARRYGSVDAAGLDAMQRTIAEAQARGQCRMVALCDAAGPIAAACFMEWAGRSILYKSAVEEAGRERMGLFRIVDAQIERLAGTGMILDFAGSNTPSVARFNKGFGADARTYFRLVRNLLPPPLRWLKR